MGHNDPSRLAGHASHPTAHAGTAPGHSPVPHHGDNDLATASHLAVDLTDNALTNWEAAWIDFGGEG
jgi:hypothetical protein